MSKNILKSLEDKVSTDLQFVKSEPVELSTDELVSVASNVMDTLISKGIKFIPLSKDSWDKIAHLPRKEETDLNWNKKIHYETISTRVGNQFLNLSSNGSIFLVKWKEPKKIYTTIANVNSDSWMVKFNEEWQKIIPAIIKWQQTHLVSQG